MKFGRAALAAMLAIGTATALAAQQPRHLNLSRDERGPVGALQAAAAGADRAAQDAALAAARSVARGADARYAVAHYQIQIGRARGDQQMVAQGVDALVEGNLASAEELPSLIANQASRAFYANDVARTDRLLARLVELQPNDPEALISYGQYTASRVNPNNPATFPLRVSAVSLYQRALAASAAAGRTAPESWHRRALALAYDGAMPRPGTQRTPQTQSLEAPSIAFARALVAAHPSPLNWHDALTVYHDVAAAGDPALALDTRRLMRASEGLGGEHEYLAFARALSEAGLPGEAKAVLDEGTERGRVDATKAAISTLAAGINRRATTDRAALARQRTAAMGAAGTGRSARAAGDAHYGFGMYAEAAELYRAALQKGGEDADLVNSRLGAALALAGRRAEAEAALQAVTGPRADLAGFWLTWLAQRPAA